MVTSRIIPYRICPTVWDQVSFAQGRVRRLCLENLSSGPRTPSSISEEVGVHLSHVSRALRELAGRGLVDCLTPKATKNRIYRITDQGKKVLRLLKGVS